MPYYWRMSQAKTPIEQACAYVDGQAELARLLGVSAPTVNQWCKGIRDVPPARCAAIERATGGKVTRADLRPDDYWLIWPDLQAPETTAKAA